MYNMTKSMILNEVFTMLCNKGYNVFEINKIANKTMKKDDLHNVYLKVRYSKDYDKKGV